LLAAVNNAHAWEDDVHYGLTKWLTPRVVATHPVPISVSKTDWRWFDSAQI
jgi:hypothetical protein